MSWIWRHSAWRDLCYEHFTFVIIIIFFDDETGTLVFTLYVVTGIVYATVAFINLTMDAILFNEMNSALCHLHTTHVCDCAKCKVSTIVSNCYK